MASLCPMLQEPVLKTTVWGGRKLESLFDLPLPAGQKIGEAWLVADHPHGTSRAANGPLTGQSLRRTAADFGEELFGPGFPAEWAERFPLLVKIIDAADDLSIQVHPDERCIREHAVADCAKTEAWVILQADPGARLIVDVQPGTDPEAFRRAARQGKLDPLLVEQQVRPGDVLFVPAGRLHAIGRGVVLAEFQQPSDTTYRVYDWGRVDGHGQGRPLHLDQAVACLNFGDRFPGPGGRGVIARDDGAMVESLIECDKFFVHRATLAGAPLCRRLDQGFECAMIIDGEAELASPMHGETLGIRKGQAAIVPAVCGSYELRPRDSVTALLSGVPRPR